LNGLELKVPPPIVAHWLPALRNLPVPSLVLCSLPAWLGPVLFVAWITRFQIIPEERVLESLFGAGFVAYRARVRRWL
jgi:protein-S-isoprenylcysteine O-methyltransferase Ste14